MCNTIICGYIKYQSKEKLSRMNWNCICTLTLTRNTIAIVLSKSFTFYIENLFLPHFSIFLINVFQKIYFFSYETLHFVAYISSTFVSFKNITVMTNKYKLTFNFLVEALKKIKKIPLVIFCDISYIR